MRTLSQSITRLSFYCGYLAAGKAHALMDVRLEAEDGWLLQLLEVLMSIRIMVVTIL